MQLLEMKLGSYVFELATRNYLVMNGFTTSIFRICFLPTEADAGVCKW